MAVPVAWSPACMDADEFEAWAEANRRMTYRADRASRPCADCTLGYASEMRAVGRCNGSPAGVEEDLMDELEQARPLRRLPVLLRPPLCRSCSHLAVCSLRSAFEGMDALPVDAPPFPGGLTVTLVAKVACAHYKRGVATRSGPASPEHLAQLARARAARKPRTKAGAA
jgi:hypothetical protein